MSTAAPIPQPDQQQHPPLRAHGSLQSVQSLLYLIVIAVFFSAFCAQPYQIPSGSMEPTLLIGDFLLVNKQIVPNSGAFSPLPHSTIHRGDIVVFHYPVDPSMLLIKRVIGVPGDHVRLHQGLVYINGRPINEPYAVYIPTGPDSFRDNFPRMQSVDPGVTSRWWIQMRGIVHDGELTVPAGRYFVLGDNRNESEDSRYWGFVPQSSIIGRPVLIYFSLREPHRNDPSAAAQVRAPLQTSNLEESLIDHVADFARWDRTIQVVH